MRDDVVNKCNSTISRIKDCFLYFEIKLRFQNLELKDGMKMAEGGWQRFFELARMQAAPIEVDGDTSVRSASNELEGGDHLIADERCYDALLMALTLCLRVEIVNDPNAYMGVKNGIDRLNSAWYRLGQAELYAEIAIENSEKYNFAAKGGAANASGHHKNRKLLAQELKRYILNFGDSNERMSRREFVEEIVDDVFAFSTRHNMEYFYNNFRRYLLGILNKDPEINYLFEMYVAKK